MTSGERCDWSCGKLNCWCPLHKLHASCVNSTPHITRSCTRIQEYPYSRLSTVPRKNLVHVICMPCSPPCWHRHSNLHCHSNHSHFHLDTNQDTVVKVEVEGAALQLSGRMAINLLTDATAAYPPLACENNSTVSRSGIGAGIALEIDLGVSPSSLRRRRFRARARLPPSSPLFLNKQTVELLSHANGG